MQVWVYPEKTHEEFGAERYEVEWYEVPLGWDDMTDDQREQWDYDTMPRLAEYFQGNGAIVKARRCAKRKAVGPRSAYGCATVTRQVVDWYVEEDRVAEWSNTDDVEYYP